MHPAQPTKALQLIERLIAKQIVHSVEHRPGMRLHCDLVIWPKRMKVQRGHDGGDRGATRLMPANLKPVTAFADMVSIVDRPG